MSNLVHRQEKMQEKRKHTPFRNFVRDICSQLPIMLYKNNNVISRYPDTERVENIIGVKDYVKKYGDNCDYSLEIVGDTSFFDSYKKLLYECPKGSLIHFTSNENTEFADAVFGGKNIYLSFVAGEDAENILYSCFTYMNVRNIINSYYISSNCDNIFSSRAVSNSYNIFYSRFIYSSSNIRFSDNLIGCEECIFCSSLENKKYMIANKEYSQEEYMSQKKDLLKQKTNFNERYEKVSHFGSIKVSQDCKGSSIFMSENIENGYDIIRYRNSRNIILGNGGDNGCLNFYDCFDTGLNSHDFYASISSGVESDHVYFCNQTDKVSNVYYSYFLRNCSFCLGCIGLKNKQFCILNKQYTKDERYAKVDEIFGQMERDGRLGEFFPGSMCPFYFNDTAAYLIDPSFTKEEVMAKGYLWRDEPIKVDIPEGSKVVKTSELDQYEGRIINGDFIPQTRHPALTRTKREERNEVESKDLISLGGDPSTTVGMTQSWYIDPKILNVIIQDEAGNVYRIVKMEYDFLMKHGLPLPRKHRLDRMKENFRIAN